MKNKHFITFGSNNRRLCNKCVCNYRSKRCFKRFLPLLFVKRKVIGKYEKEGTKDLSPIRCKQQTLSPVAVKISGTTGMCFLYQKTKPTDVPMLSGNLPRNELTASAFATTAVSGVLSVSDLAVCKKVGNRKM